MNKQSIGIEEIAKKIILLSRNALVVKIRFLDIAIHQLKINQYLGSYAVDGEYIYYDVSRVTKDYLQDKNFTNRALMHMLLHCIFKHFFIGNKIDRRLWDLSCDIAVENVLLELELDFLAKKQDRDRVKVLKEIENDIKIITAEKLYRYFKDNPKSEREINELEKLFLIDDHSIWYKRDNPKELENGDSGSVGNNEYENSNNNITKNLKSNTNDYKSLEKIWNKVSERIKTNLETFSKNYGDKSEQLMQNLQAITREKYNYTEFLRKFAVLGEVMKINEDEFDYIFYMYGLTNYKKMPLIEPLEYKEEKRIKEFVIAIDTSGSVRGELVQRFIQKTYNILKQEESFFTKINLHIIQCDTEIQEDACITSQEEFDTYISNMQLKGFGGTDFRPVFEYVDNLIKQRTFSNLKGLIYFTDGCGVFPQKQPNYNTAFVFIEDDFSFNNLEVPVWAIKLILEEGEI